MFAYARRLEVTVIRAHRLLVVLAVWAVPAAARAEAPADKTHRLADGVRVSYVDNGKGDPALVFVHCGNCRKEIWTETLAAFADRHRVIALDLPGHGRSSAERQAWSIPALGADVAALVQHLRASDVVLVGNSLGGPVSLEAARILGPRRVRGVVAVDTLHDVEFKWPEENLARVREAYRKDFASACDAHMLGLLPKDAPAEARARVQRDSCDNDPRAFRALFDTLSAYDSAAALRGAGVPVVAINSRLLPTNLEANRRHAPGFDVVLMDGVGHYPQVERPAEFQAQLRRVLETMPRRR